MSDRDDDDFDKWLEDLKHVFITGHGYDPEAAKLHVYGNAPEWRGFWEDGYTPRTAAITAKF